LIGRRSLLVLAVRLVSSFLGFIGLFLITNYLGPDVYGAIVYVLSLLAAFNAFSDLGFNQAHIKKVSEGQDIRDCVSTFIVIKLALTGLLVVVTIVSLVVWTQLLGGSLEGEAEDLVILFTLYYVFYNLSSIVTTTYYGTMEIAKAQVIALADPIIKIPLIALIALGGGSAVQLAYAYVAAGIAITVVAFIFLLRDRIKWTRPTLFRAYILFAIPLALVTVVGTVAGSVDKIMIGYFDSNEAVAFYSSSQLFLSVVALVGVSVATLTYPSFSKSHTDGDVSEIKRASLTAERYLSMFGMPITALLVLFPTEIAVALFGPEFAPAGEPMRWLAIGMFLTLINAVHSSQINAVNRPDITAKLIFLHFFVLVPLLILLVPSSFFGLQCLGLSYNGAALASMITSIVVFVATRWIVRKLTGTRSNPRLLLHLASAVITGGVLVVLEQYLPMDNWMILLAYVFMALAIFAGILYVMKELTKEDVRYFMDIFNIRKMWRYSVDEVSGKSRK